MNGNRHSISNNPFPFSTSNPPPSPSYPPPYLPPSRPLLPRPPFPEGVEETKSRQAAPQKEAVGVFLLPLWIWSFTWGVSPGPVQSGRRDMQMSPTASACFKQRGGRATWNNNEKLDIWPSSPDWRGFMDTLKVGSCCRFFSLFVFLFYHCRWRGNIYRCSLDMQMQRQIFSSCSSIEKRGTWYENSRLQNGLPKSILKLIFTTFCLTGDACAHVGPWSWRHCIVFGLL